MNATELQFSGNAEKALAEMRKIAEENKRLKDSMEDIAKASRTAADVATKAMQGQTEAIKKLAKENENLKKKLEDQKKAQDGVASGAKEVRDTLLAYASIDTVRGIMEDFAALNAKILETKSNSASMFRDFEIAAGKRDPALQAKVFESAKRVGVTSDRASGAAAMLMQAGGLTTDQATGGVLTQALLSQELLGKGTGEGIVSFLDSAGQNVSEGNIQDMTRRLLGFQKAGAGLSGSDLSELAGNTAELQRLGVGLSDQLAITAALRDKGVTGIGGGLSSVSRQIAKLGTTEEGLAKLQELGLSSDDTDMASLGIDNVIRKIMGRIEEVDPQNAKARAMEMFGKRADIAQSLYQFGGDVEALRKGGLSESEFQNVVGIATTGVDKEMIRTKLADEEKTVLGNQAAARRALYAQAAQQEMAAGRSDDWMGGIGGMVLSPLAPLGAMAKSDAAIQQWYEDNKKHLNPDNIPTNLRADFGTPAERAPSPEDYESLAEQRRDPREAAIAAKRYELDQMRLGVDEARNAAMSDGRMSPREKKELDRLEQPLRELTLVLQRMELEMKKPVVVPMNPNADP